MRRKNQLSSRTVVGMKTPRPLPQKLRQGVFTRREAEALGVPAKRLRAADLRRVGRGFYEWTGRGASAEVWEQGTGSTEEWWAFLRSVQTEYSESWFSHITAAQIYDISLPRRLTARNVIHISRPQHSTTTRRVPSLVSHAVKVEEGEVTRSRGIRVSSPCRVFFDLMGMLSEQELVVLGDQLVRVPRPQFEGRSRPWATRSSLEELLSVHRKTKGIVAGRSALEKIRVGADSPPETMLRLAIIDAGLPEPQLQPRPSSGSWYSGDLGYEELKIVIQYDGGGHFTAVQQSVDQRRDHAFEGAGWAVIIANSEDLREGFAHVIERLRHAMQRRLAPEFGPF